MSIAAILDHDTVASIVLDDAGKLKKEVVYATKGEELKRVALKMTKFKVSGIPILSHDGKTCIGVLDFPDIVHFLLYSSKDHGGIGLFNDSERFWNFLSHTEVSLVINASKSNSLHIVTLSTSLRDICILFQTVRRVIVVDANQNVVAVVSPTALLNHLLARMGKTGMDPILLKSTVESLHLGDKLVTQVFKSTSLIESFKIMVSAQHTCAAVTETTHVLAGSVSMSDI
jgi:CBS domain-containing protein